MVGDVISAPEYGAAIRRLWTGRCTVTVRSPQKDGARTRLGESNLYVDEPCRISFSSDDVVTPTDNAHRKTQRIRLFIGNEISIPEGSKITVTQNKRTGVYTASGVPAVYSTHQEIDLELFGGWA